MRLVAQEKPAGITTDFCFMQLMQCLSRPHQYASLCHHLDQHIEHAVLNVSLCLVANLLGSAERFNLPGYQFVGWCWSKTVV